MMVNIYAEPRGRESNFNSDLTETLKSLHTEQQFKSEIVIGILFCTTHFRHLLSSRENANIQNKFKMKHIALLN